MKKRADVDKSDQWDLDPLFKNMDVWESAFGAFTKEHGEFDAFGSQDLSSKEKLGGFLKQYFDAIRQVEKLFTYAHLRHDEDMADGTNKGAYSRALALYHKFSEKTAWFEPAVLELDAGLLSIDEYAVYLKKILDRKPHTLDAKSEALLAAAGQPLETASKAFSALNNADLKFDAVQDSSGKEHAVSHGSYSVLIISSDRKLRQGVWESIHGGFKKHENTCAELLNGAVQKQLFYSRARRFKSCMEAALFPNQIDPQVYYKLIDAAQKGAGALQQYLEIRRERLGVDKLKAYDLYAPLVKDIDLKYDYADAVKIVIDAVEPLGEEYQAILTKGLKEERWVDVYENEGKRSGAYSSGCFDSPPYMLMNYTGTLREVSTLAHEAGHSMHSFYSNKNQPYHYASYSIFVAEVASTLNEELLFNYLLERAESDELRTYLICQKLDDMRSTFFRQTLFAEFELKIHEMAERGEPITPDAMKALYRELNKVYYGGAIEADEYWDLECMRIPHFYYNFYVYQYATGISAAFALADQVLGQKDNKNVLKFLSAGSSKYPLDVLKDAGVDMRTDGPVNAFTKRFEELIKLLS